LIALNILLALSSIGNAKIPQEMAGYAIEAIPPLASADFKELKTAE